MLEIDAVQRGYEGNKMSDKCSAKTELGKECRAPAVVGTLFCAFHGDPERAAELGRMGGRKNRHYVDAEPITIAPPSSPEEVKNLLAQAMVDVLAKKMDPRIASTLTYMAGPLLKAFESTDVQQRLASLEESRAKADKS